MVKQGKKKRNRRKRKIRILKRVGRMVSLVLLSVICVVGLIKLNNLKSNITLAKEVADNDILEEVYINKEIEEPVVNEKKRIEISSLGTILVHSPQMNGAKTSYGYDFSPSFEYIKDKLRESEFASAIVETTFPGTGFSGYPTFGSPDEVLVALKDAGINIINYANNHILDRGTTGFYRTLDVTNESGIDYLGVRKNIEDDNYLVKEIQGEKIGIMSYAYETNAVGSRKALNGIPIAEELTGLVNTFNYGDLDSLYYDVETNMEKMKSEGVKFIIVALHWGEEYVTTENETQRNIAKRLNEMGVDILLGGHPHVIQPFEILTNKSGKNTFVVYSQGNNLSNQTAETLGNPKTEDGLLINFTLEGDGETLELIEYEIIPTWLYREPKSNGTYIHRIIPVIDAIENKEMFKLSDSAYERVKKSLISTKNIIGENVIGVTKIKE